MVTRERKAGVVMRGKSLGLVCCSVAAILLSASVRAGTVSFSLDYVFSGTPVPGTTWATLVFDDGGGVGSVKMKFTMNSTLSSALFISELAFNLDPAKNPSSLAFSPATKTGTFDTPAISTGADAFQADGDGKYDVLLSFETAGPAGTKRFNPGESIEYTMTLAGITASSFDVLSAPAGGAGPFKAAAHVQGFSSGSLGYPSVWVAPGSVVPLPAAAWMGMALMGSLGGVSYLRKRRQTIE